VVHRDIKPANLVLTADDGVKITDFGTAKILQFGTAQTAHVMGTPSYMSPEQVKGKPVDGRSDIFSLGVILYELMTGEKPFPGQNITTVIYKIVNEEPIPPRSLDSSIHPGLSAVITRALAKNPDARFQTCHELLNALKNYHEMVNPDAKGRVAPGKALPVAGGIHPDPPQTRLPAAPLKTHPRKVEPSYQLISAATLEAEEASKKRVSLLLSLIFLGIIGFAGYRIWPAMTDLWQRAHEPVEKQLIQPKPALLAPAANSGLADTKSGAKPATSSQVAPPVQELAPPNAESSKTQQTSHPVPQHTPPVASQQVAAPAPPAKPLTSEPPSGVGNAAKSAVPRKPDTSSSTPAADAVETRLRNELAMLSLAEKVKVQVTANALTLSGRVTPREHLMLLNRLHWVPANVRVVDDLEYMRGLEAAPATASVGWVWVRSEPPGAEILVDGADSRLRTPARVEIPQGVHQVRLILKGFPVSERTVLVQPGQTMLFTQPLAQQ
jgi:cytoskeletal protein RodZ